jgi:DNA-binding response OmpR family regulator
MSRGIVLLVEDNEKLNEGNRRALEGEGYTVHCALTLEAARAHLSQNEPDIILLDVGMPDGDGFSFCEEIRANTTAHIIFLTARREHIELLQGLGVGGDDYITKPFRLDELLGRAAAAMRRKGIESKAAQFVRKGNLTLDAVANRALVGDIDLELQPREFSLLHYLVLHENELLTAENIYTNVWKNQTLGDDKQVLRQRVSKLRNKLQDNGCTHTVNTVYGKGYRFEPASQI